MSVSQVAGGTDGKHHRYHDVWCVPARLPSCFFRPHPSIRLSRRCRSLRGAGRCVSALALRFIPPRALDTEEMVWEMLYDNTEAMLGSYTLKARLSSRLHKSLPKSMRRSCCLRP